MLRLNVLSPRALGIGKIKRLLIAFVSPVGLGVVKYYL